MYMDTHNKLSLVCHGMGCSKYKRFKEGGLPGTPQANSGGFRGCWICDLASAGLIFVITVSLEGVGLTTATGSAHGPCTGEGTGGCPGNGVGDKEDAQPLGITAEGAGLSPKGSPGALGVQRPAQGVWGC